MDGELKQLRSNMHEILSEQQQEFAQAFGLHHKLFFKHVFTLIHSDNLLPKTLKIAVTTFFFLSFPLPSISTLQRDQANALGPVHTSLEKFENAIITGHFRFVFEENLDRKII